MKTTTVTITTYQIGDLFQKNDGPIYMLCHLGSNMVNLVCVGGPVSPATNIGNRWTDTPMTVRNIREITEQEFNQFPNSETLSYIDKEILVIEKNRYSEFIKK